ncbi:hypothetical protein J6S88_00725 [bacterium]|nr:hypothetical protein [bacterium]
MPLADEDKYYQENLLPIIQMRYQEMVKTKEETGIINQEYFLRAIQQLMNEEKLPIVTMRQDYNPQNDKQFR